MRVGLLSVCLCVGSLASAPGAAHAQDASASETAAARQLFEDGIEALEQEQWADAAERFERSYQLVPRTSTLLNLATAQAEQGLVVEAIETYRRFLAEATERRERRLRGEAERMIEELEPRIAHVELVIPQREPGDLVRLDDRELPVAALEVALPMSPGLHRLTVTRGAHEIGTLELALVEGERRSVQLALHPPAPALEHVEVEPESAADESLLFIGLGVGAGVVLVTLIIVLGVVLSGGEEAFVGNLGPGMVTF